MIHNTSTLNLPMVYLNRNGEIVKLYQNGKIEVIKQVPIKIREDNKPFENEGAYAEDDIED